MRPVAPGTDTGVCHFCFGTYPRKSIPSHLRRCLSRELLIETIVENDRAHQRESALGFHLLVTAPARQEYWLHLELLQSSSLEKLDFFLRSIWLNCCPHPSFLEVDGVAYWSDLTGENESAGPAMKGLTADDLAPKKRYRYCFAPDRPTELRLQVLGRDLSSAPGMAAVVVARNSPVRPVCQRCAKRPAEQVCLVCEESVGQFFCIECADTHHEVHATGHLIDSPRVGVCRLKRLKRRIGGW